MSDSIETIAKQGDIIITDDQIFTDGLTICRVVKVRPAMWSVETMRSYDGTKEPQWSKPHNRKIEKYTICDPSVSPEVLAVAIGARSAKYRQDRRDLLATFRSDVFDMAKAPSEQMA